MFGGGVGVDKICKESAVRESVRMCRKWCKSGGSRLKVEKGVEKWILKSDAQIEVECG